MSLRALIAERIRDRGPLTAAEFMDLALYHPTLGYYTRAPHRTGRAGDFFTSVDVGPQFGALLASQIDEMNRLLAADGSSVFDLVEAGAGNGQLARDLLDAAESTYPGLYAVTRLTLVETSAAARAVQPDTLGRHRTRLAASPVTIPDKICGAILANELLDALPTHAVTMTSEGLREIYIDLVGDRFVERTGPPSIPELAGYLARLDVDLAPGWRGEINLAAVEWVRTAARRLERGFMILIDYGHTAGELYSENHNAGTLTTFHRHLVGAVGDDPHQPGGPAWLTHPGEQDITAHVDLTSVAAAAEAEGLDVLGLLDQSYFLLGLGALDDPGVRRRQRRSAQAATGAEDVTGPGRTRQHSQSVAAGQASRDPSLAGLLVPDTGHLVSRLRDAPHRFRTEHHVWRRCSSLTNTQGAPASPLAPRAPRAATYALHL